MASEVLSLVLHADTYSVLPVIFWKQTVQRFWFSQCVWKQQNLLSKFQGQIGNAIVSKFHKV